MRTLKRILHGIAVLALALTLSGPLYGISHNSPSLVMAAEAGPSAPPAPAALTPEQTAIQQVIARANAEQVQAIAGGDPTVMADTATSNYYQDLVKTNKSLASDGVTDIKLSSITWGPITVQGSKATALTDETWITSYRDGRTVQSTDRNTYALVLTNGAWKIASDAHAESPGQSQIPGTPSTDPSGVNVKDTSRNWSGYSATGANYTAVSGTWTIPQPGGTSGVGATWVGIGGVSSHDLIQAGTQEIVSNGRVQYSAWIEMLPKSSETIDLAVHSGDSVSVSLAEQTANNWLIQIVNATTGQKFQRTVTYSSSRSSVEWVEEAPSGARSILPLENFGTVTFTNGAATAAGKTMNISQTGAQPIKMIDSSQRVLAVPSALSSDGAGFSVTRTSTPSTTTGTGSGSGRRIQIRTPFGSFGF